MKDEKGPYKDYMVQKHMNNRLERDGRCTESSTIEENSSNIYDDLRRLSQNHWMYISSQKQS